MGTGSTQEMTLSEREEWERHNRPPGPGQLIDDFENLSFDDRYASAGDGYSPKAGEFLHIIPVARDAEQAFNRMLLAKERGLLGIQHAQFLEHTGQTKHIQTDGNQSESMMTGYYSIGFHKPSVDKDASWRIGQDSAAVDILMDMPGTIASKIFNRVHMTLHMNLQTGAWILTANAPISVEGKPFTENSMLCLSDVEVLISINTFYYKFKFVVTTKAQENAYMSIRNEYLQQRAASRVPPLRFSGIPFKSDMIFSSVRFRNPLGSGTHGTVFQGFEPEKGFLRAIKRVPVKTRHAYETTGREVRALAEFQNCVGIVKLYDFRSNNGERPKPDIVPGDIYIIQEMGVPFRCCEEPVTHGVWQVHARVMYQLLLGLFAMHKRGWMHRDITRNNLLYAANDSSRAMICDFGTVHFGLADTNSCIANEKYLPPEVTPGLSRRYDYRIDIFMLALALAQQWFPDIAVDLIPGKQPKDHVKLVTGLLNDRRSSLSVVLASMLHADPTKRPDIEECLEMEGLTRYIPSNTLKGLRMRKQRMYDEIMKKVKADPAAATNW